MKLKRIELTNYRQHRELDVDFEGNMIAVLGCNGCLAAGTPVRMYDGTVKCVEDVRSGDVLLAFDDASSLLTRGTVSDMIMTSPSHKPKPMMEVEINGEKTCTTYDHPFFAGDGFYPLYQLVWGALEERQRTQLKLLCKQYGAPFDDTTVWKQNSCRDEASARSEWVLQNNAKWAYCETASDSCGGVAGKSAWTSMREPFRLQPYEQQGGESGVVQRQVQCVVWGNPWQHKSSASASSYAEGRGEASSAVGSKAERVAVSSARELGEKSVDGDYKSGDAEGAQVVGLQHSGNCVRIEVLEAAPYYTIRMREAPYAYCIGRRNCYLVHNSGKSNLLGAIQFALTGEQPPFEKKDLTTWGEKEGSVKLVFLAGSDNKEFVIVRKTNGDVTLSIDGGEKVKGAKKVAEVLKDIAGLDKELLRQVVFVPQKGIDAILFDDPKAREVAFQRLIGIGEASKIYEALRTEIQAYDKPSAFNEAIAKARQQLEDANKSVGMCAEKMGKYDEAIAQLPTVEDLNKEAADALRAQTAVDEYIAVRKDLAQAMSENEALIAGAHHDVGRADPPDPGEEEALREKLNELATQIAYIKRLDELARETKKDEEAWERVKMDFDRMVEENPSIAFERGRLKELEGQESSLKAELRHLNSLASEDSATGECPLCGSHVEPGEIAKHVKDKIGELEAELNKASEGAQGLRKSVGDFDRKESEFKAKLSQADAVRKRSFETLSAAKDKGVEGVEIDLHTFAVSYKGKTLSDVADLDKERIAAKDRLDAIAKLAKDEADYVAKLNKVSARIDVLKGREKAALEKLTEARIDASNPEELSAKLAKKHSAAISNRNALEGILRDAAEEKGKHKMLLETIERTKASLSDLEAKQKLDDQLREKVEVLKRAREWFNFREGPRIMSQNVMRDLCGYVNDFLDQFCAPFVVEAEEEGFGFRCRFIDGRQMPDPCPDASLLSGGQKVMLAIAFRMAIYMRFGGELGLLSLDEPTAYLDDAAIEHLGDLLVKVGQIARNKGLQMLMATHEKAIMGFMDTKIEVGAKQ